MNNNIKPQIGLVNINGELNIENKLENKIECSKKDSNELKGGICRYVKARIDNLTLPFIAEQKYNGEKLKFELESRLKNIPDEYLTKPRPFILENTTDSLRCYTEEEQIREMFMNLLQKEIDSRTQYKVLPAYIEMIKQLSMEDAKFIIGVKEILCSEDFYIISVNSERYVVGLNNNFEYRNVLLSEIVLDNLERLHIIKYDSIYQFTKGQEQFLKLENYIKCTFETSNYEFSPFKVTKFGKQFIEICCS